MKEITCLNKIQIFRPFLKINKNSIISYNIKNKLFFFNDPSNFDETYTRVKVRHFLQNQKYKKLVHQDFLNLKRDMPYYKNMIWNSLIQIIVDVKSNQLIININKLFKYNNIIIEKIILICLKYFSEQKYKARSSKINLLMVEMQKSNFKTYNLNSIFFKKNAKLLTIYKK